MLHIFNRRSRGIFYLIYWIGECGVRCHWRLFVTITPLLPSATDRCVLWCLLRTWCCHYLLHLSYVLAICMCCGAWSAPGAVSSCCTWHMCWLYVVLGAHLCVGYVYCGVLGAHLVQEWSGPCKIPNFFHLLWSYGTYMYFVRHVRIGMRQS